MDSSKPVNKYVRVTFSNGDKFDVPAEIIAKNRANHYANEPLYGGDTYDSVFKEEFDYTMKYHHELTDWLFNNMDWKDVKNVSTKVESVPFDYDKNWLSCSENEPKVITR